ncbi:MAG: efflux RND transporter periplasmic adaptor subunit [Bryobacterales bacterium]|jgi:RND family efflux transporter MFP subunit|nr:efflux RND transporter periplasmic adaptor subunit [Bryobacterales bacterium]
MKKAYLWFAVVVITGVGGVAWWFSNKPPAAIPIFSASPSQSASAPTAIVAPESPREVEVLIPASELDRLQLKFAKVTEAESRVEVRVPGTVQVNAYKQVRIVPIAGGVVTEVVPELGQTVKRGQVLARIFSRELAEAQTEYSSFVTQLEVEHKKLVRTQELVNLGAASRQELEEVEGSHKVHAAHVEEARQRLLLLGLTDSQVDGAGVGRQAGSSIEVAAPLDGIVTARSVNSGQVVVSGQELFTVSDLSSVWIEANVLENDFGATRIGSLAIAATPAYPNREYRGVVEYIDPQVDPQTRTGKVRVSVDNPGAALRLGMYMDVLFTTPTATRVPVVPKAALQIIGTTSYVFVSVDGEPGRFLQRAVEVGPELPSGIPIRTGLKRGEAVVTEGSFLLRAEATRQHP